MTTDPQSTERQLGLIGATLVGIGAIVGGGILALAGIAFASTGPSAILAFAVNGILAVVTALSFAEMASSFPESGGSYAFARKVFSVETAFAVGWVVWFASIVAAVLYALGFGSFAVVFLETIWDPSEWPNWLQGRPAVIGLGALATSYYGLVLYRRPGSSGQLATIGKVIVFAILILAGAWVFIRPPETVTVRSLSPFFSAGGMGFLTAMGYTFIALQGFDLIAAVGGEVRDPVRTIPRAMLLSLAIALVVYIPFLLILCTVGVAPGETIASQSASHPETAVILATQLYLGPTGFWLVLLAGLLSMLSALCANVYAASRVALAMARDRNLPQSLSNLHPRLGTPAQAVVASTIAIIVLLLLIGDVSAAGAVSSLIFLISFALVHITTILARIRMPHRGPFFRTPLFPLVPVLGLVSCLALALFQGFQVPAAGRIAAVWIGIGGLLYLFVFAPRARVFDASAQAHNPDLLRLRGRSPLVLVPIANPASAPGMVAVANALAPPGVGRVLLLSVVTGRRAEEDPASYLPRLEATQHVLRESLTASFAQGMRPEALTTIAAEPWGEIARVAALHDCESLLLGFSHLSESQVGSKLEELIGQVTSDVVVLRAPAGWTADQVRTVLVPVGGRGGHDILRARLLSSLNRSGNCRITFLRILPGDATDDLVRQAERDLRQFAEDEISGGVSTEVVRSDAVQDEVVRRAAESDLLVLGLQRKGRHKKTFGRVALEVVRHTHCATVMISRGR